MRRLKRGGIALAVLLGLAVPVLAGDQDSKASSTSWWGGWFGKSQVETPVKDKKPAVPIEDNTVTAPPAPTDAAGSMIERERTTYFRRLAVCDRLKMYADQAGDAEAVRRVEQLEERAFAIYQQRTSNLSGGGFEGVRGSSLGGSK